MLLLCALLPAACAKSEPEAVLRETVAAMQQAVESRDIVALMRPVAEDFVGSGGLDRDGLQRLARLQFLRHASIGVHLGPLDVELFGDRARVRFTVVLTGGAGGLLPETGQLYDVDTGWRLDGDRWRLVSAVWQAKL
ncbi:MAG: nuclear transport factor 2 family protein [Rehaibacterium terrae]|uniref:nuclear transport factor 2 family protein n=1 Tax=Rehaibacterium terrae TaxID=1341696 RepID=UPI00391A0590